ncbi:hypothetical protein [Microbacterium sp.]|uniref:hypothetical protein n=1 Tax=Microbacterium sp. TaxID=51671 RepID=UPI0031FE82C3|nr:hypothetical protein [Microbacterium sp.]
MTASRDPMRGWRIAAAIVAGLGFLAGLVSPPDPIAALLNALIWYGIVWILGKAVTYWTQDRKR